MGVMGRANQGGGGVGNGEPFLNKDELIRYRTPLAIVDIAYDPFGSTQYRNPRWVLTVEAWDQNLPIPEGAFPADRDLENQGLVTFGDSPVRQSQFGTGRDDQGQPIGLSAQLEDARSQGAQWIGPVAVISDRSNRGQPFKTLADVKLDDDGNVVTDARGFAVLEGVAAEQNGGAPRRQAAPPRAPAAAPAPPAPAPVQQTRRSTGQRQRAAAPPAAPAVPAASQAAQDVPTGQIPANQAPPRVPRASRTAQATPQPVQTQPAAQPAAAPRRPRQSAQTPSGASSPEAYEAQVQQAERRNPGPNGPAPGVQERTEVTVEEASATCPFCNTEITGRLYPSQPEAFARFYAESARAFGWPELTAEQKAAGGQVIPHPHCPMLQQTVMLPFVQFAEESAE